jgi:hypothetical protein
MCVRTKTSYGCGCEYKTNVGCQASSCSGLERYHYPKRGDCKACKEAGNALTRGRDGRGRYGQEISKRSQSRQDEVEQPLEILEEVAEVGHGISPWASATSKEKDWMSRPRRQADDAWLEEHSERNLDLQSIREALPSYSPPEHSSPAYHSPQQRPTRIYVLDEDVPERDGGSRRHCRRDDSGRSMPVEIRSVREDYNQSHSHRVYRRRRQDSQESFESLPSTHSSTKKYRPAPPNYYPHEHGEIHDSGYGSYGSRTSEEYGRAKTEPYHYSSSPAPRLVSVKGPSPHPYAYHTGYGVAPVNLVTRTPTFAYGSRRY